MPASRRSRFLPPPAAIAIAARARSSAPPRRFCGNIIPPAARRRPPWPPILPGSAATPRPSSSAADPPWVRAKAPRKLPPSPTRAASRQHFRAGMAGSPPPSRQNRRRPGLAGRAGRPTAWRLACPLPPWQRPASAGRLRRRRCRPLLRRPISRSRAGALRLFLLPGLFRRFRRWLRSRLSLRRVLAALRRRGFRLEERFGGGLRRLGGLLGLVTRNGDVLAARDPLRLVGAARDDDRNGHLDFGVQRYRHLVLPDRLDR